MGFWTAMVCWIPWVNKRDMCIVAPETPPPTLTPTRRPTLRPTPFPTLPPTPAPTPFPTERFLELDLELQCVPREGFDTCNDEAPPLAACLGGIPPTELMFVYHGGNCDQSISLQKSKGVMFCADVRGGPSAAAGTQAFVHVTDLEGQVILHSDFVAVGSTLTLRNNGGTKALPSNHLITIHEDDQVKNPAKLLQVVQFRSTCPRDPTPELYLKDRFGGVELVEWTNDSQGRISTFVDQPFNLDITAPLQLDGGTHLTLTKLVVHSNSVPPELDLSDKVTGLQLTAGETVSLAVNLPVDLTTRKTYQLWATAEAAASAAEEGARASRGTSQSSFTAGYPVPPGFPVPAPAPPVPRPEAPTSTTSSRQDPSLARCHLEADIECRTSSNVGCRTIAPPSHMLCDTNSGIPSKLEFLVTGQNCGLDKDCYDAFPGVDIADAKVHLSIRNARNQNLVGYNGVVDIGTIVTITEGLEGSVLVFIYTVGANDTPGQPLQANLIETTCHGQSNRDVTLLQNHGALQVVSFTNADQGTQTVLQKLTFTYVVRNDAVGVHAQVVSAVKTVPRSDPTTVLSTPPESSLVLAPGQEVTLGTDVLMLNAAAAAAVGTTYQYDLEVSGIGVESGQPCFDEESYVFKVG